MLTFIMSPMFSDPYLNIILYKSYMIFPVLKNVLSSMSLTSLKTISKLTSVITLF